MPLSPLGRIYLVKMIKQTIILSSLYMIAQTKSDFEYSGQYNQPEFISGILNTMNEFRSVKNLQWDQEIANCAFVTACFRQKFPSVSAHGHAMGMRPCHTYTCGGVTCKKTAASEGAFQFDIRETDGYQKPIRDIVANPDGGHEKPILSLNTTRIGCATHIADKVRANNANLYCDYSKNPDCHDENCCNQFYKTKLKECKEKVSTDGTYYFRSWDVCDSFPNADHVIAANIQMQTNASGISNPETTVQNIPTTVVSTTTVSATTVSTTTFCTTTVSKIDAANPETASPTIPSTAVSPTALAPSSYPTNYDDTVSIGSTGMRNVAFTGLFSLCILIQF